MGHTLQSVIAEIERDKAGQALLAAPGGWQLAAHARASQLERYQLCKRALQYGILI